MNSSISVPTDNIYKFWAVFGLVLIIASFFSFAAMYNLSLEKKVAYTEEITILKNKPQPTTNDQGMLKLNEVLLKVTKDNEKTYYNVTGGFFAVGFLCAVYGFTMWKTKIQKRDDIIADLQEIKLKLEIDKLKRDRR